MGIGGGLQVGPGYEKQPRDNLAPMSMQGVLRIQQEHQDRQRKLFYSGSSRCSSHEWQSSISKSTVCGPRDHEKSMERRKCQGSLSDLRTQTLWRGPRILYL